MPVRHLIYMVIAVCAAATGNAAHAADFVNFESGQVQPLALTGDGSRLLALNTPDNRLEIYAVRADGLQHTASVPVGLDPVAVALRSDDEAWVVNHLSDSVSIVRLDGTPRVVRTLLVGDEPRGIVFAGGSGNRVFVSTAHRGQQRTHASISAVPGAGDPQLTTPGIGRADVWVFDATNLGATLGGTPLRIVELFSDTPRALAASPDGLTVYAAAFMSGNRTAVVSEGMVCDGFSSTACNGDGLTSPNGLVGGQLPGGLPGPTADVHGDNAPETGLVVQYDGSSGQWRDAQGRNWSNGVRFDLPDQDVFAIDAQTLAVSADYRHVGTVLFNMAANPVSGKVYVSNTDAQNLTRFEGPGTTGGSTVQGNLHQARITVLDGASVLPRHLNKHIDYAQTPAPAGTANHSLATPTDIVVSADGATLYVAAFGSGRVGVLPTAALEDDSFDPTVLSADYIALSAGGPAGLALSADGQRLFVLTRFDNGISVIDTQSGSEIAHRRMPSPEPDAVVDGRPFLYDAALTSSNGEASCSACHIFGDFDALAWDLGDPDGEVINNPIPVNLGAFASLGNNFPNINGTGDVNQLHPMKGPMTTQTLRGMVNSGAMHWRGDRAVGVFGTDASDEVLSFKNFNVAFPGLLGRDQALADADMAAFTDFALTITLPPNPVRALNNTLSAGEQAGQDFYLGTRRSDGLPFDITGEQDGFTCNGCHGLDPSQGFFGTDTRASFENEQQILKIPHLRNMYQKVGMFGMPHVPFFNAIGNGHMGDQVRGTGFLHDGSTDTMLRFFNATVFNSAFSNQVGFPNDQARQDMERYMLAFDTDLAPIVGQQITLTTTAAAAVDARIDLLLQRAAAPFVSQILGANVTEADVVASGVVDGQVRSYLRAADGMFVADDGAQTTQTAAALRASVNNAEEFLTFTAVPPGSGTRIGLDRDLDGIDNGADNCAATANADQADDDSDGVGNACDNCTLAANATQSDTNGDGYGNACDADLNNDGIINAGDLGLLKLAFFMSGALDADFNGDLAVNAQDLGIMRQTFFGPPGPSAQ